MPDYDAWNHALITYFVAGSPPGAPVFLTADDDTVALVGERLIESAPAAPATDPVRDFERAIRARVVGPGERVVLAPVMGSGVNDEPRCAAFLCALVLAASRMRDTGDIDDVNYFTRLRDILRLPGRGRPPGMEGGAEEPLWQSWNFWLQVQGHLPTATPGPEGPQRYIHYARSQALLRDADKDKLRELFQTRGWRGDLDAESLLLRVRREPPHVLTVHLRELLASDSQRLVPLADAIHELYEAWRLDPAGTMGRAGRGRTLYAGLYREADPLSGTVCYQLYPHLTRGGGEELRVRIGDRVETLRPEREHSRWYYPVAEVDGATLAAGARYPIEQPAELRELVLPARDYWILVPDPEMPDSGVHATWGRPELGEPFILLCQEPILAQFNYLVQERLVECPGEAVPVLDGSWYELRDCYVVSEAWSGAHLSNPELYDALRPTDKCNVIVSGGLRLPGRPGWLDGAGPSVTVSGFAPESEVIITDVRTERVILERTQRTGEPIPVPWPGPGAYQVLGRCAGQEARRAVTIAAWDELRLSAPAEEAWIALGGHRLCGAALD